MKTMSKKILSVLLAVLMVVCSAPFGAFSALAEDDDEMSADMQYLVSALAGYEAKMDDFENGTVYTNMYDAYVCYQSVYKLLATYKHDELNSATDPGIRAVADKLIAATDAMQVWNYTGFGTQNPHWIDDGKNADRGQSPAATIGNIIYATNADHDLADVNKDQSGSEKGLQSWLRYPSAVLLYDGVNDTKMPIGMVVKSTTSSKRYIHALTLSDTASVFTLPQVWNYIDNKGSDWTFSNSYSGSVHINNNTNSDTTAYQMSDTLWKNTTLFTNYIKFNGGFGSSEILKTTTPTVTIYADSDKKKPFTDIIQPNVSSQPIYIVNYKALIDAINNAQKYGVDEYHYGGLSGVLKAFDAATSYNPFNTAYNNLDVAAAANSFASDIQELIDGLSTLPYNNNSESLSENDILDNITDLESEGNAITAESIIYTHKANENYSMYGQEISDDYLYRTSNNHMGERCTLVSVKYPYYIDINDPLAIYCMTDEEHVKNEGATFSDIKAEPLYNGKWVDDNGNQYTDSEAASASASLNIHKQYYLVGSVSDYFKYNNDTNSYTHSGVELAVRYKDITATDNNLLLGEYVFCYVMPNPAMAHTIIGIRNQSQITNNANRKGGIQLYDRFENSYGQTTNIISNAVDPDNGWYNGYLADNGGGAQYGGGTFNYLGVWGSPESTDADAYKSPEKTRDNFTFYSDSEGIDAGTYAQAEHTDNDVRSYAVASPVALVNYYVDYSDTDLYDYDGNGDNLVNVDSNGKPTGYSFNFRTSNILWNSNQDRRWGATSYFLNNTGLTLDSAYNPSFGDTKNENLECTDNASSGEDMCTYGNFTASELAQAGISTSDSNYYRMLISGTGSYSTNNLKLGNQPCDFPGSIENRFLVGMTSDGSAGFGRKLMSGYLSNPEAYDAKYGDNNDSYSAGMQRGFQYIDSATSSSATNVWNAHITFNGKDSVHQNTDTSSAEKYANFVVEQGISIYSWYYDAGVHFTGSTRSTSNEETYAYYNIGVDTCDKGAVREFVNTFVNKEMTVYDVDGNLWEPNSGKRVGAIIPGDDIQSKNYSISSYKAYLKALAEAYWFVENPQNTTYTEYVDENGNTVQCAEPMEYTTAYGVTPDGNQHAMIYADDVVDQNGNPTKNIFGETSNQYGTVKTDPVQAKIIHDIIVAYENLFDVEHYEDSHDLYEQVIEKYGKSYFTHEQDAYYDEMSEQNRQSYDKLMELAAEAYGYKTDVNVTNDDYWRKVILDGNDYRQLDEILSALLDLDGKAIAMPSVDQTELQETINNQNYNLYANATDSVEEQSVSFGSWSEIYNLIQDYTSDDTSSSDMQEGLLAKTAGKEKYKNSTTTTVSIGGEPFSMVTYDDSELSDYQKAVNDANELLASKTLVDIDDDNAYEAFKDAYNTLSMSNMDKYTPEGKELLNDTLSDEYNAVYTTISGDVAQQFIGTSEPTVVKVSGKNQTDAHTANILSEMTVLNDTSDASNSYVKQFNSTFTVQKLNDDDEVEIVSSNTSSPDKNFYGEQFSYSLPDGATGAKWSYTTYEYNQIGTGDPTGSKKNYAYGDTVNRIANADIAIVAEIKEADPDSTKHCVKLYSVYGRCYDIIYTDEEPTINTTLETLELDGVTYEEVQVPFYTQTGWRITKEADGTYAARSLYVPDNTNCKIQYKDGNKKAYITQNVAYDKNVTISYTPADTDEQQFVAWALECGEGYGIVSYNRSYTFASICNENFVPVVKFKEGDSWVYKVQSTSSFIELTADMVDGDINNPTTDLKENNINKLTDNEFLYYKLENKLPFVSITDVQTFTGASNNGTTVNKLRAYARVTQGSNCSALSVNALVTNNADIDPSLMTVDTTATNVKRVRITNIDPESGVFLVTVSGLSSGAFRMYANYDFEYHFEGENTNESADATVSTYDYSSVFALE